MADEIIYQWHFTLDNHDESIARYFSDEFELIIFAGDLKQAKAKIRELALPITYRDLKISQVSEFEPISNTIFDLGDDDENKA